MSLSKGWQDTVAQGLTDARWDAYDGLIQAEITSYNTRFLYTPNYSPVSWLIGKAMLWTESGGPDNPAWHTRALQIGNKGDPAYGVLRKGTEGSDVIMADDLRQLLKKPDNIDKPEVNIRAGLAYLFTRMASYAYVSRIVPWAGEPQVHTVVAREVASAIASREKTTLEAMAQLNPGVDLNRLKIGQQLKIIPAFHEWIVSDWLAFQSAVVAERFNGGGDPDYSAKLNHLLLDIFPKLKRP